MELFHVLNRGVDKRKLFLDDQDRYRFLHDLFEFNDELPASTTFYKFNVIARRKFGVEKQERKPRKFLVDILAFCLMPNHYHLFLRPRTETKNAIPRFMKKLNMGYARYFNERYERKGALFEGRYKSVSVKNESHFIRLPYYIHLNPLDLFMPEWRRRSIRSVGGAMEFLNNYRWSSHLDYAGKKNFPSITQRELLGEFFAGPEGYLKGMKEWLQEMELGDIADILLE